MTILFTDKWITCRFKPSLSDTCFIDCQILYIQYLLNRWPYLNLCLLRELPLYYSSNNKLKRLTVQMLQSTRSRNMAVTYITPPPPHFSISSSSSYTVFSAFVCPASFFDLGESHPVQHFSWLSLGSGSKTLSYLFTQTTRTNVSAYSRKNSVHINNERTSPSLDKGKQQSNFSVLHCFVMHFILVMGSLENCTLVIIYSVSVCFCPGRESELWEV